MFCQNCGSEIGTSSNFCPKCGLQQSIVSTANNGIIQNQEPGRGTLILIIGILGLILNIIFIVPILSVIAWIMGSKDLKKIKSGIIAVSEKSTTKIGWVLGIVGTIISLVIIAGIAIVVGINLSQAQSEESIKDSMVAHCTNIGAMAQQYYKKPMAMGGGGSSFDGFEIPISLETCQNGKYYVDTYSDFIIITGYPKDYNWKVVSKVEVNYINSEIKER